MHRATQTRPIQTQSDEVLMILRREFYNSFVHCDQLHRSNDVLAQLNDDLRSDNSRIRFRHALTVQDLIEHDHLIHQLRAESQRKSHQIVVLRTEIARLRRALRWSAERTRPIPQRLQEIIDANSSSEETEWVTTDSESEDLLERHVGRRI